MKYRTKELNRGTPLTAENVLSLKIVEIEEAIAENIAEVQMLKIKTTDLEDIITNQTKIVSNLKEALDELGESRP